MKKKFSIVLFALLLIFAMYTVANADTVKMNKTSATIQVNGKVQLSVQRVDSTQTAVWKSSDVSVATVDGSGLVTGKTAGSSVITATVDGITVECVVSVVKRTTVENIRYNVLILDTSGSMQGIPLAREKAAAKRFCKTVLNSKGKNYLAIVTLNSSPTVVCNFTNNLSTLNSAINKLTASGGTNMNAAFQKAGSLLNAKSGGSSVMKNIILCSDGLPERGTMSASGRYTAADHEYYKMANAVYKTDVKLKNKDYFIYALGFFHNSQGASLKFGKRFMKDLASKDKYFIVTEPEEMEDVFDKIAADINNVTINKSSLSLYTKESYKLTVQVNGENRKASWKTSNRSIAIVYSNGKVVARKKGTVTITATVEGQTVTCKVQVKPSAISLNKKTMTLKVNQLGALKATVTGRNQTVVWTSEDSKIARVSKNGKVRGVSAGKVKITATANGISASCVVTVKAKPRGAIYTVEDLKNVANDLDGTYYLMKDLNLGSEEWTPIGTSSQPFTGEFHGNGHTIKNLYINKAVNDQGLFGVISEAYIERLQVTGNVKSGAVYAGGIAGRMTKGSKISYCVNRATVSGVDQAGGIVGRVSDSTVEYCLNYGKVTAGGRGCGGITADIYPSGKVLHCVNMADVAGGNDITGGITGGSTNGTITRCYNAGNVTGSSRKGAIAGDNAGYAGPRSNNYFLQTSTINAGYSVVGSGSGTFKSLQYTGLRKAIAAIRAKF